MSLLFQPLFALNPQRHLQEVRDWMLRKEQQKNQLQMVSVISSVFTHLTVLLHCMLLTMHALTIHFSPYALLTMHTPHHAPSSPSTPSPCIPSHAHNHYAHSSPCSSPCTPHHALSTTRSHHYKHSSHATGHPGATECRGGGGISGGHCHLC